MMTSINPVPSSQNSSIQPPQKRLEIPLIAIVALSISLAAPVAALVGYFFLHGYLSTFGLNVGFFPRSFHEYVLGAFTALIHIVGWLQKSLELKGFLAWVAVGMLLVVYIKTLDFLGSFLKRMAPLVKTLSKRKNFSGIGKSVAQFALWLGLPGIVFLVLLVLIMPSIGALLVGKGAAKDIINGFPGCTEPSVHKCGKLYDKGTLIAEGMIIEASDSFVAIYDHSTAKLLPLTSTSYLEVSLIDKSN